MIKKKKYYKLRTYLLGKLVCSDLINPIKPKFHCRCRCWCRKFPPQPTAALCCPCLSYPCLTAVSAVILSARLGNRSGLKEPLSSPQHFFIWIDTIRPHGPTAAEAGLGEGQQRQEQEYSSQPPPRHQEGFAILYFPHNSCFLSVSLLPLYPATNFHKI